ncbi:hypothetical protein OQA88_13113 [Cercophora sp. LCS_1]
MALAVPVPRRKGVLIVQICACFVAAAYLTFLSWPLGPEIVFPLPKAHHIGFSVSNSSEPLPDDDDWVPPSAAVRVAKAQRIVPSILDPSSTSIQRVRCPAINSTRYALLIPTSPTRKYLFALNLRQCIGLLPRLMGSILEAITFLGPENCALSVVEGNSNDGTLEVLRLLTTPLDDLSIPYYLVTNTLDPTNGDRIKKLAILRALALEPLTGPSPVPPPTRDSDGVHNSPEANTYWSVPQPELRPTFAPDTTVIFINDVAACAEDLLELAYQRTLQNADMTCAMDWAHGKDDYNEKTNIPFFYDAWIGRDINGEIFFEIDPETTDWKNATNLFPHEPVARQALSVGASFQVFACWNGAVAFGAEPIMTKEVEFRWAKGKECFAGEVQLFCKDLWMAGRGKIAVVPSVNLQYSDKRGTMIKKQRGYVSDYVKKGTTDGRIEWRGPPEKVKCMPNFNEQSWVPWNEPMGEEW